MTIIDKIKEKFIKINQKSSRNFLKKADDALIEEMFSSMNKGPILTKPSKYWEELNRMNFDQLKQNGYENFKKTIALNYFTWVRVLPWNPQILFLVKYLSFPITVNCIIIAIKSKKHEFFASFNWIQSVLYNFLTYALSEYVKKMNLSDRLKILEEPLIGGPPLLYDDNSKLISQDLFNSIIEFDSIVGAIEKPEKVQTVMELGAGYGRNAFVFLSILPKIKYIIIDIPPALWVAQEYLSQVFEDKKVFKYREFDDFNEVLDEYNQSDIIFLLSSQIKLLPRGICDLVLNISSLHEMRIDQITYYFDQFNTLIKTDGFFYYKQWKNGAVLFENTNILEKDYPIPSNWREKFSREARVQTQFFEAMYVKG